MASPLKATWNHHQVREEFQFNIIYYQIHHAKMICLFFLEPFKVGPPKQESRRKETKQSITYTLEIKSEFKPKNI